MPTDLDYRHHLLHFDGVPLDVAERMPSPFFLLSRSRILENLARISADLAGTARPARIRYCAKTNYESPVLATVAEAGNDIVVSHIGEAELALCCGFAPHRIAFQQPVLAAETIERAIDLGLGYFHVFHRSQVDLLEAAARASGRTLRVSLRLSNAGQRLSLGPAPFITRRMGLSLEEAAAVVARVAASPRLQLIAINFYAGTQLTGLDGVRRLTRQARTLALRALALGCPVDEINVGGGIPSPSLRRNGVTTCASRLWDRPGGANRSAWCVGLVSMFREEIERGWPGTPPALVVEPGRAVVGDAGILVTRVRHVEGRWVFVDASRNHLPESFVLFSRRILAVREAADRPKAFRHFSGGTLNTMDVLDLWRRVPSPSPDDLLVFADAGANSIARANQYAGPLPAVHYTTPVPADRMRPVSMAGGMGR